MGNKVSQREEKKKETLNARCEHGHTGAQPAVMGRVAEEGKVKASLSREVLEQEEPTHHTV